MGEGYRTSINYILRQLLVKICIYVFCDAGKKFEYPFYLTTGYMAI